MNLPLHRWSAVELQRALARRELTAATLAAALIERSTALDHRLKAWVSFEPEGALARALGADAGFTGGAMHGLPLAVKDNIDVAGFATRCGSPVTDAGPAAADAACVGLATAAGAWVLGKTVCTEFANMTPAATVHPLDAACTPGGSSSGSAVAVAAGLVPLALGTQTAGSVIRPAAYCGIVGYKPSPRRVPRAGVKPNADSLDEVGVLARSVGDAALLARAIDGRHSPNDSATAADATPCFGCTLTSEAGRLEPAMLAMIERAVTRAAAGGAAVGACAWPASFSGLFNAQRHVQIYETARALAPEAREHRSLLSPELTALLDEGAALPHRTYAQALQAGHAALATLDALFGTADVLMVPAAAGAAPRSRATTGDPVFSRPWQLLGCPCIALPGGVDEGGLPLGLQLVARPGDDERLFAAAAWLEARLADGVAELGRALD